MNLNRCDNREYDDEQSNMFYIEIHSNKHLLNSFFRLSLPKVYLSGFNFLWIYILDIFILSQLIKKMVGIH